MSESAVALGAGLHSVGGFRPYFLATSVWAYAASHSEYRWAISISDLARLIALWNMSMARSRFPLEEEEEEEEEGYFKLSTVYHPVAGGRSWFSPLNLDGSHSFVGEVTFVVDLDGLADELQTQVQVLLPLELQQPGTTANAYHQARDTQVTYITLVLVWNEY